MTSPSNLDGTSPEAPTTWKSHAWPGPRGLLHSFSPSFSSHTKTTVTTTLLRRLSMYTILSLRVLVSIALIAFQFLGIHIWGIIIGCIIAVLNLVFIFWCLAMIERAEGVRHVCGLRVGRTHLDMFLFIAAILHISLVACTFSIWRDQRVPVNIVWFTLWLLIAAYGFISSRQPISAA